MGSSSRGLERSDDARTHDDGGASAHRPADACAGARAALATALLAAGVAHAAPDAGQAAGPDTNLVAVGNDIPPHFVRPTADFDYVRREVMIPMRDGVRLYTVIVVPKGAHGAPILLTRTPYDAAKRASAATARRWRRRCRRATTCSWPAATSGCSRTCAASTAPRATT